MAQWTPPDYIKLPGKSNEWTPPDYVKPVTTKPKQETKPQVEQPKSLARRAWDWADTPLTNAPTRLADTIAEPLMKYGESGTDIPHTAAKWGGAWLHNFGEGTSGLTRPDMLALMGTSAAAGAFRNAGVRAASEAGGFAKSIRLAQISKALETPGRVASAGMVGQGGYKMATADNIPDRAQGAVEASLGVFGLRSRIGRFPKPNEVLPAVEEGGLARTGQPEVIDAEVIGQNKKLSDTHTKWLRDTKKYGSRIYDEVKSQNPNLTPEELSQETHKALIKFIGPEPTKPDYGVSQVNKGELLPTELGTQKPRVRINPDGTYTNLDNGITVDAKGSPVPSGGNDDIQFSRVPSNETISNNNRFKIRSMEDSFVESGDNSALTKPVETARYKFFQPDDTHPEGGFHMYDIQGGPSDRSTVSAQTLEKMGIPIPPTPDTQIVGKPPRSMSEYAEEAAKDMENTGNFGGAKIQRETIKRLGGIDRSNSVEITDKTGRMIAPPQQSLPETRQLGLNEDWQPPDYVTSVDEPQFSRVGNRIKPDEYRAGSKDKFEVYNTNDDKVHSYWPDENIANRAAQKIGPEYDIRPIERKGPATVSGFKGPIGESSSNPVDELTYRSYRQQRLDNPSVAPERWKSIFGESVNELENRFKNEPNDVVEGPQFARSEQGGIKIGANIERAADEVTTAYSSPLSGIMVREGMQNALDAVRHLGSKGHVKITLNDEGMQIHDNGKGMSRQELETVFSNLNETGKVDDENATGGKGVGTASYMLGGKHFTVETITKSPKGAFKIKITAAGTRDEFLKHVPVTEEVVPSDTPTGTVITTKFLPGQSSSDARSMLRNILAHTRGLDSKISVNRWNIDEEPKSLSKGENDKVISRDTLEDVPNDSKNDVVLRVPSTVKLGGRQFIDIQYLNNGMYQFSETHYLGDKTPNLPDHIIVDIHPNAKEGTKGYPFPTNRESLKDTLKEQIRNLINTRIVIPQRIARKNTLRELYASMPVFEGSNIEPTRPTVLFDPGNRLTSDELNTYKDSPAVNQMMTTIDSSIKNILDTLENNKLTDRLEKVGIVLDRNMYGVHIPNPDSGKSAILINPLEHIAQQSDPRKAAFNTLTTVSHEVAHIGTEDPKEIPKISTINVKDPRLGEYLQAYLEHTQKHGGIDYGHGIGFVKRLGEIYAKSDIDKWFQAVDKIHAAITDRTGEYSPEVQNLLSIYLESRGRPEVTTDFLSGTGDQSKAPKGRKGTIPGDNNPNGKGTPVEKLIRALNEHKINRSAQNELYSEERSIRAGKISGVKTPGLAGYYQRAGMLKGELPKIHTALNTSDQLNESDINQLMDAIQETGLKPYDKFRAQDALHKILSGRTLQDSQINVLTGVFGEDLGKTILLNAGLPIGNIVNNAVNLPKTAMSTLDMSAPLRQGLPLIHKTEYWNAFYNMFKYYGSEKTFQGLQKALEERPKYDLGERSGLILTDISDDMTHREEQFMSTWLDNFKLFGVKPVRASSRAYTGFLNKLRADTFDNLVDNYRKAYPNEDFDAAAKSIAKFVNNATGRGSLGKYGERIAVPLNGIFYSPRLLSSRLTMMNPKYMYESAKTNPLVFKEHMKSLLAIAAYTLTMAALYKLAGGQVSSDPTSSDFAKGKFGRTHIDPMGGFQQPIVAAMRLISGREVSASGKVYDLNNSKFPFPTRAGVIGNFIRSKESPAASFVDTLMQGEQAFKPGGLGAMIGTNRPSAEIINRLSPMIINDLIDIAKSDPDLLGAALPAFFGQSIQTMDEPKPKMGFRMRGIPNVPVSPNNATDNRVLPNPDSTYNRLKNIFGDSPAPR